MMKGMAVYTVMVRPNGRDQPGFRARVNDDNVWRVIDPEELKLVPPFFRLKHERLAFWQRDFLRVDAMVHDTQNYAPAGPCFRYAQAIVNAYSGSEILKVDGFRDRPLKPGVCY